MADLSIDLAGIRSPNPFWLASAPAREQSDRRTPTCASLTGYSIGMNTKGGGENEPSL